MLVRRFAFVCVLLAPFALHGAISSVSDGERASVEAAAAYLAEGPPAIAARLAAASPLRLLAADDVLNEIEARLGPPAGAQWELETVVPALQNKKAVFAISYPSGIDETVVFDLVDENGAYRIHDLRIAAMPSERKPVFAEASVATAALPAAPPSDSRPAAAALVAALLGMTAAVASRWHRGLSRMLMAAAIVPIFAAGFFALRTGNFVRSVQSKTAAPAAVKEADHYPRLAKLLPLRKAIASGTTDAESLQKVNCVERTCADVATLWRAQLDLEQSRTAEAKKTLQKFSSPSNIPLVEILRGRIALLESDAAASALAFEHAVNLGPGRDAIWFETAQSLMALGFEDRATKYLQRLDRMGSRSPSTYYALAAVAGARGHDDDAEKYLRVAWDGLPVQRASLLGSAAFASVLRRPEVGKLIPMSAAAEAKFTSPVLGSRAVALPAGATAKICGNLLRIQIGEQELQVPGGAALAPFDTPVIDAATWDREEKENALREYQQLVTAAQNAGAFTQPALRRRVTRTAEALAERNRWADVATLTETLSPQSEHVPADLFFLRDMALERLNRRGEALALLQQLAGSRVLARKRDARALEALGNMLATHDQFDAAIAMFDKALAIRPNPMTDDRVRQIEMNRRLATKYSQERTRNFEVRYPDDVSPVVAKQIAAILEAELQRLQKWVPLTTVEPITVNVVWWGDFRSTYTGNDFVLGFYQGKITVPLAGVAQFVPPVVGLLTHELCHAMLAQATHDQAPSWFHEGLAQRVEMTEYQRNAFNMYDDDKLLAMSVLDATIQRSGDPDMISEAYIESQTVIRYIESKYGERGIGTLIAAFRDGATTEEAIAKLTGQSVADFDTGLRAWGRAGSRVFENPPPVRYDLDDSEELRWSKKAGKGSDQ